MIETTAIDSNNNEPMMVIWSTGRRCNYDCTYCESTRHDLNSPHHSFEELLETYHFIKKWTDIYNSKRVIKTSININFTGGEPTVTPAFWKLVEYIKNDDPNIGLGLTTNGTWSKKYRELIPKYFNGITVSWHAEAAESLRNKVLDNIMELHNVGANVKVNVMLHVDHWDESVRVCDLLETKGIKYSPRPIGDGNNSRVGWFIDHDGTNRRTSHTYSVEQQQWFFNKMGANQKTTDKLEGDRIGRGCCGQRCLTGKIDNEWQPVKLINTQFKSWQCTVDWYFLYVEQHTGEVFHHQTCQALHGNKRGPIGLVTDNQLLIDLENRLNQPTVEAIVCPNNRCGCGMCVPKARDSDDFKVLWQRTTTVELK